MKVLSQSSPFGSRTRTRILITLELLGESYARELARTLGASLSVVQKALRSLELDGLVAGRAVGRTRTYVLNPGYFAARELRQLTRRLAEADDELSAQARKLRSRPRRSGKPL